MGNPVISSCTWGDVCSFTLALEAIHYTTHWPNIIVFVFAGPTSMDNITCKQAERYCSTNLEGSSEHVPFQIRSIFYIIFSRDRCLVWTPSPTSLHYTLLWWITCSWAACQGCSRPTVLSVPVSDNCLTLVYFILFDLSSPLKWFACYDLLWRPKYNRIDNVWSSICRLGS